MRACAALQEGRDWIWLAGNHDPAIAARVRRARLLDELKIAGLDPAPRAGAGRRHARDRRPHAPGRQALHVRHTIRRPCFVGNGRRLVMPAFGAFTGGLNVLDEAFSALFGDGGMAVWMLGHDGLYPVATRALSAD